MGQFTRDRMDSISGWQTSGKPRHKNAWKLAQRQVVRRARRFGHITIDLARDQRWTLERGANKPHCQDCMAVEAVFHQRRYGWSNQDGVAK